MRKRIQHLVLSLVILIGIGVPAGYLLVFASVTESYEGSRSVLIPRGLDIEAVTDSLTNSGILKKKRSFSIFALVSGWGDQVKAGHYIIDSGSSNKDILTKLRRGLQEPVRVMVPAGARKERIARAIARNMAFSTEQMMQVLRDSTFAAALETDTTQLFGYLLPETYFFYWLTSPEDVARKIKAAADTLIANGKARADTGSPDLSPDEVLRLAAIVEWETARNPEKARIAGVYLNRIRNGWPLQADPTVQYVVMMREGEKRRLLYVDYDIRHPYNTYNYRGLPPGPITNPSASSIRAVLEPEEHGYFFFVATGDGSHIFSRTLSEHNRRANEYRKLMKQRRAEAQSGS